MLLRGWASSPKVTFSEVELSESVFRMKSEYTTLIHLGKNTPEDRGLFFFFNLDSGSILVCKRAIDLYFNRRRPWDVQRIGKDWCCIKRSGRCRRYVLRGRKRALEKAQTHGSLSRHRNNNNISGCESHRAALSLGALALEQSLGDDEVWTNDCFSSVGPSTGMTGMKALSRTAGSGRKPTDRFRRGGS